MTSTRCPPILAVEEAGGLARDLSPTPAKRKARRPSGIAVGPDGDLYVAERKKLQVRRFSSKVEEGDVHR